MSLPISDSSALARAREEIAKAGDTKSDADLHRGRTPSQTRDTKSNADLHRGRTPRKPKPKVNPKAQPKGDGKFDEAKHRRKGGGWGGKKVKGAGQFDSKGGGGEAKAGSVGASGRKIKINAEAGNPRKGKQYVEIDDPKGRGKIHVYGDGRKFLVRDKPKPESAASASARGKATEGNARAQAEAKEAKARSKGKVRKATDVMDDLDISIDQAHEMMAQADIDCGCDGCMVHKSFYEEPYTEEDDDEAFDPESEPEPEYAIYKSSDEKRRTVGVLYMPDTVDAHGEFVSNDELENATVEFFQKGNFDIRHQHRPGTVLGEIVGVMSWPYETEVELLMPTVEKALTTTGGFGGAGQAPLSIDQMSKTKHKLPPGTVYATVQWTPMAWPLVKSGAIGGFSMGGRGVRVRGATPATEGRKPEMQGGAGTGVGSAGAGHLAGPRPAGAQAAAGEYDGEGQLRKHALGLSDPGSQIDIAKRALFEPDDEEIYDMIRPEQADEMGGEAVPVEIDRYLLEEGAEMADEEDGEYDEATDDMDDDPTARLLVLAAMGNRTARAMINLAGGSSVLKAADSPMKAATPKKGLETDPGPNDNWVERTPAGKLPNYIEHVALAIHRKRGMPKSQAIATAIGTIKRWAAGDGNVDAGTRAAASRAVAEWEALKASAHAK